jgi:indolepyruvate ferredoxin oxidoreductase beta subunit
MKTDRVVNVVIAGLGGQGVVKASDILSDAAFRDGYDVKKAEVHGMSQRGGSVTTDVRFGPSVLSPMVPEGEADFLLVMEDTQEEPTRHLLRPDGTVLRASSIKAGDLPSPKTLNVAALGLLSVNLPVSEKAWESAVRAALPAKLHDMNMQAFAAGRRCGGKG